MKKALLVLGMIGMSSMVYAKGATIYTKNQDGTVTVTTVLDQTDKDAQLTALKEKLNIAQIHLEAYQEQEKRAAQGVIDSQTEITDLMQEITDLEAAK